MNKYCVAMVFKNGRDVKLYQVVVNLCYTEYFAKVKAEEVVRKNYPLEGYELILKYATLVN